LDPALLRPGRFDRQVVVDRADFKGREKILEVHARNKPLGKEVSLTTLAKRTPGFSGADLENLLNEAALLAARRNKNSIEMLECDEAIDRVMVGPERKSLVMSPREKETTAYHESGHALLGALLDKSDPIHKVTIIPRGMALGMTWSLPDDDRHSRTREELIAQITMALGGRLAEEIKFGDVTTGASNDFEKATELARRMVTQYGMSELGPIQYGRGAHQVFLGRDFGDERSYSEEIASKIDAQVRTIIESSYVNGKQMLETNWGKVERMVASLLEYETVDAEEVRAIIEDRPFDRPITEVAPQGATDVERHEPKRAEKPTRLPPNISPEPA
jgi:cell division protease FtsH